ncbi:MAG: VWA domain-containing protein [Spirochaetes bacterium]|nr:VWA domain-containing protein [Spirochaetota bacterium]NLJ05263.1 VWA domain-containing protein [Exilispira sp.]MBP8990465.1 VWA domain-containing protein [Spirochaetota bacterium]HOV45541.1 VWA domain-containing protein [Exilispira sp.]HPB47176.1 VWA domain-containing protein [Exilispira sp.]
MRFSYPLNFLLLIPAAGIFYLIIILKRGKTGFPLSSIPVKPEKLNYLMFFKYLFLFLVLFLLIIGSTSPMVPISKVPIEEKGHAFVFCLDISSTMKALDFAPQDRFFKAKETIKEFIDNRKMNFYGLVIFAKYSLPIVPLTFDNNFLIQKLESIQIGDIEDGTAIGNAIINAVELLKYFKGESKNIILITDGINNDGYIDPIFAVQVAKNYGMKVYPIAIGSDSPVNFPFVDSKGLSYTKKIKISVDIALLRQIAQIGGDGKVYTATNSREFDSIFKEIEKQNPIELNIKSYITYKSIDHLFYVLSVLTFIIFLFLELFSIEVEY